MDPSHNSCEKCSPAASTSPTKLNWSTLEEIVQVVTSAVNSTIHTAIHLIINDFKGEFFYPDPRIPSQTRTEHPDFLSFDVEYKEKFIDWVTIQDFSVNEIFTQVRDYINLWHLSDATKYTLVINDKTNVIPRKGAKYFLDAIFSKPTPACPNPLAVAKVFFTVIVPELLPKHYPVKVVYRFEGYRTHYHATGPREVRTKDFQRYFIDSILQRKLIFYAKIFECNHPHIKLNTSKLFEENEEEEEEDVAKPADDFDYYELNDDEDDADKPPLLNIINGLV